MALPTFNCVIPQSGRLAHWTAGGEILMTYDLPATAPTLGQYLAFLPKQFSGWVITSLKITMPYLDTSGLLRWQVGIVDTTLNAIRPGDASIFAGSQFYVPGNNTATQLLVNGMSTNAFTGGIFNGDDTTITIAEHDLIKYTVPYDRLSNGASSGDYNIGLVCSAIPTGWIGGGKQISILMRLIPRVT